MELTQEEIQWLYRNLRSVDFFADANVDDIDLLLRTQVHKYSYKKGQKICKQGTPGDAFFMIYKGKVSVTVSKGLFQKTKVTELGPGQFFGEMALISNEPRTATVIADEWTECFAILKFDFNMFVSDKPLFAQKVRSSTAQRKFELRQK